MSEFHRAVRHILKNEGGFVDHPNDPGGSTKYGISLRFLRAADIRVRGSMDITIEDILDLTEEKAIEIYKEHFWDPHNYELINSQKVATKVFDLCVNIGPRKANSLLQEGANYLLGESLTVDSIIGPKSISAVNSCDETLLKGYIIQGSMRHYLDLVLKNKDLKIFYRGWINRAIQRYND